MRQLHKEDLTKEFLYVSFFFKGCSTSCGCDNILMFIIDVLLFVKSKLKMYDFAQINENVQT